VNEAALSDLTRFATHLDACAPAVNEVELVLRVVKVVEPLESGREDDSVDAERGDAEGGADFAEAGAVAELVERGEREAGQSFFTISSASSRVNARRVSVCSAPYRWSFIRISTATSSSGASKISTTS
jgi:hypothetical protein